ncbi:MAG: Gfo/Idh/MocA family oxidoreductase [Planctomycetia bacterium]|nr:Gfo/Idh/MocA family oxidoreductase [Planctomycetia bacterium]
MKNCTRREMLKWSTLFAAAPMIVPRHVLGGDTPAPNDRITLAGIGVGGVGRAHLHQAREAGFQIVALCDIDHRHAKKTFDDHAGARLYKDFRELLSAEGEKVDAVYCGSPDHTHAIITLAALREKKHVCCVKPLTRTIEECRVVAAAAKKAGVATQVTMQSNTSDSACRIIELIKAGAIGNVREVHAWSARPVWPQGMVSYPTQKDPVPEGFDWDMWLGPAEKISFADKWPVESPIPHMSCANWGGRAIYHPFNFRGWTAFGTGSLGDMGCHRANLPYRALKLKYPTRVTASSTRIHSVAFPLGCIVTYDYPAREEFPELRFVWYDGGLKPAVPRELGSALLPNEGVLYVGDEGVMLEDRILDPERAEKFKDVPRTIERRGGVFPEWYEACAGGQEASANFEYSTPVTEFVLLGNLALQTGKAVEFDPETLRVTNNPEAQALVAQPYHNGWSLHD